MPSKFYLQRNKAFKKQTGHCYYCGYVMWQGESKAFAATYDMTEKEAKRFQCTAEHLLPRSEGGSNRSRNIVAACYHCNSTRHKIKNAPKPLVYKGRIQKRLRKGKWHPKKYSALGML